MTVVITLTPEQYIEAAEIGLNRRKNGTLRGLKDRFTYKSMFGNDIEAAVAECAAAVAFDLPWTGRDFLATNTYQKPPSDIGDNTQVRWVHDERNPAIKIDPDRDDPKCYWVLISDYGATKTVHGFIFSTEARTKQYLRVHHGEPMYVVPASALTPPPVQVAA